jgi:hypothetical protein
MPARSSGLLAGSLTALKLFVYAVPAKATADAVLTAVPRKHSQHRIIVCVFAAGFRRIGAEQQKISASSALERYKDRVQAVVAKKESLVVFRSFSKPAPGASERAPNTVPFAHPGAPET